MTFAFLLALLLLGGCTASMAVIDDAMSEVNGGGNCSFSRLLRGQTACAPPAETVSEANKERVYCYQTLGGVDCYEKQDPFAKSEGRNPTEKIKLGTPVVGPSKPATKVPVLMMGKAKPMAQTPATTVPPMPKKVVAVPAAPPQAVTPPPAVPKPTAPAPMVMKAPAPQAVAPAPPVVTIVQPPPPPVEPATPSIGLSVRRPVAAPAPTPSPPQPATSPQPAASPQSATSESTAPQSTTPTETVPIDEMPATALPPKLKPSQKVWPKPATPAIES